ncbi:hypothetical protein CKAH01_18989 [Colletotrichum kahawae]|uniref:Uncharacterized protein n=1 Tax=Colletotrichum kahawae TaxID=34407 RepID=A0AAD9Y1S8_COLKA|nr:hypothetical protein CKAH01_18989 [Colletotrichum kahawae]
MARTKEVDIPQKRKAHASEPTRSTNKRTKPEINKTPNKSTKNLPFQDINRLQKIFHSGTLNRTAIENRILLLSSKAEVEKIQQHASSQVSSPAGNQEEQLIEDFRAWDEINNGCKPEILAGQHRVEALKAYVEETGEPMSADWKTISEELPQKYRRKHIRALFYPHLPTSESPSSQCKRRPNFLALLDNDQYFNIHEAIVSNRNLRFPSLLYITDIKKDERHILSDVMAHVVSWVTLTPEEVSKRAPNKPSLAANITKTITPTEDHVKQVVSERDNGLNLADYRRRWGDLPTIVANMVEQDVLSQVLSNMASFKRTEHVHLLKEARLLQSVRQITGEELHPEWIIDTEQSTLSAAHNSAVVSSFFAFADNTPEVKKDTILSRKIHSAAFEAILASWFAEAGGSLSEKTQRSDVQVSQERQLDPNSANGMDSDGGESRVEDTNLNEAGDNAEPSPPPSTQASTHGGKAYQESSISSKGSSDSNVQGHTTNKVVAPPRRSRPPKRAQPPSTPSQAYAEELVESFMDDDDDDDNEGLMELTSTARDSILKSPSLPPLISSRQSKPPPSSQAVVKRIVRNVIRPGSIRM